MCIRDSSCFLGGSALLAGCREENNSPRPATEDAARITSARQWLSLIHISMARSHMGICLNLGITPGQLCQLLDIVSRNIGPGEACLLYTSRCV